MFILDNYTTLVLIGHTMFSEKHTYLPTTIKLKKETSITIKIKQELLKKPQKEKKNTLVLRTDFVSSFPCHSQSAIFIL